MKKLLVVLFLCVPCLSFAQTDTEIRSNLLQTLLTQFVAQVNAIDAMQAEISLATDKGSFKSLQDVLVAQLQFSTQSIAALLNPTAPIVVSSPILGNVPVTPPVVAPVSKAAITVEIEYPSVKWHYFTFMVSVLDENGKPIKTPLIHMQAPDLVQDYQHDQDDGFGNSVFGNWRTHIQYIEGVALTPGTQVITFTSGNLSKSITVTI